MHEALRQFIETRLPLIDQRLHELITSTNMPENLKKAMAYSVDAGGKRIRPLLVLATLEDIGSRSEDALTVACAVEMIHTYSLIHDDLPCMDDDDFRRGKPTNHKVFGEAVAVLAGDALQALAFRSLTELDSTPPEKTVAIMKLLGSASGAEGMVGGQILDMEGEEKQLSLEELETVHLNKTGALLSFCIEAGAILGDLDEEGSDRLRSYAKNIGLAFQIKDDILDITSTTEQLGKTAGSDTTSQKSTYPSLLGLEGAIERLEYHHQTAKEAIGFLGDDSNMLRMFADYIVERNS